MHVQCQRKDCDPSDRYVFGLAKPWTVTLKDVTVREVLDQIAQQFGPSYGWQFYGAQNFRMITFHESLEVRSPH
jgi:hypothetical protein